MSKSKGNELLQDLYERLKGRWENVGKYAGQSFTVTDVKEYLTKILREYNDDTDFKRDDRTDN